MEAQAPAHTIATGTQFQYFSLSLFLVSVSPISLIIHATLQQKELPYDPTLRPILSHPPRTPPLLPPACTSLWFSLPFHISSSPPWSLVLFPPTLPATHSHAAYLFPACLPSFSCLGAPEFQVIFFVPPTVPQSPFPPSSLPTISQIPGPMPLRWQMMRQAQFPVMEGVKTIEGNWAKGSGAPFCIDFLWICHNLQVKS